MHKRKILYVIFAVVAVMIVIVCRFAFIVEEPLLGHIEFDEMVYGKDIEPYYDETDDIYYLFIPSYADAKNIKISHSNFVGVNFSDETEDYGKDLSEVPLTQDITLTLTNFYQKETYCFQICQCDELPTVYVETESGSMEDVDADKDYEEDASVIVIDADGTVELNKMSSITGRGNSTWNREKNPYNLKFSTETTLWDFEDVNTLCLLSNYFDYSCMRDAVVHYAAKKNDIAYSSDYQFVNLYTNGNYMGLYGLATKQEYKKYIEKDDIAAVFEVTKFGSEDNSFQSDAGTKIEVSYGDISFTKDIIDKFEDALFRSDFETAFLYVDEESFAKKYTLEEFFLNFDMTWINSQYFYIDTNGIIHSMCAWDYDRSFGFSNGTYYNNHPENEMTVYFRGNDSWYKYLIQSQDFCSEVAACLHSDYSDSFLEELDDFMEICISEIESSWQCNNTRWEHVYGMKTLGFENLEEFSECYEQVASRRGDFLEDYLLNQEKYSVVSFVAKSPQVYANLCIPNGEKLSDYIQDYTITGINKIGKKQFLGWYTKDDLAPEDIDEVTEDITFYGTWEKSTKTEKTSAKAPAGEQNDEHIDVSESSGSDNPAMAVIKKIYHGFGLDSFGTGRLAICVLFGIVLLVMFCVDIVRNS